MHGKQIRTKQGILQEISKYSYVMLYGAGEVGKRVYNFLARNHVEVISFLTTKRRSVKTEFCGLPVYEISEIDRANMEETLVIISTQEYLHEEILQETERYETPHVICVSDDLYNQLKQQYPREKLNFQIHIVEHCNLNCKGCYHFSPLAEEEYLSIDEYYKDLKQLSNLYHCEMDEIMLLGGEPLLHPQIAEFMKVTRECFPQGKIKILSNGILIPKLTQDFWKMCASTKTELWLTKYPINIDYQKIEEIASKNGIDIQYFSHEPVRTLGRQPLDLDGKRDYKENFRNCYRENECVLLDHGKMYSCVIPAESKHFSKYFNIDLKVSEQDYVDIYKVKSGEDLQKLLMRPMPFCRYCNRDDVAIYGCIPWDTSKRKMEEWL